MQCLTHIISQKILTPMQANYCFINFDSLNSNYMFLLLSCYFSCLILSENGQVLAHLPRVTYTPSSVHKCKGACTMINASNKLDIWNFKHVAPGLLVFYFPFFLISEASFPLPFISYNVSSCLINQFCCKASLSCSFQEKNTIALPNE